MSLASLGAIALKERPKKIKIEVKISQSYSIKQRGDPAGSRRPTPTAWGGKGWVEVSTGSAVTSSPDAASTAIRSQTRACLCMAVSNRDWGFFLAASNSRFLSDASRSITGQCQPHFAYVL